MLSPKSRYLRWLKSLPSLKLIPRASHSVNLGLLVYRLACLYYPVPIPNGGLEFCQHAPQNIEGSLGDSANGFVIHQLLLAIFLIGL